MGHPVDHQHCLGWVVLDRSSQVEQWEERLHRSIRWMVDWASRELLDLEPVGSHLFLRLQTLDGMVWLRPPVRGSLQESRPRFLG